MHDLFVGYTEALRGLGQQVSTYDMAGRLTFYDAAMLETGRKGPGGEVELRKAVTHQGAIQLAANGLLSATYQFWPHVIVVISAFFIPDDMLDLLRARGHAVVIVFTESPYQDEEQLGRAAHCDLALLNDPTNLERFREVTAAAYVPHSYRPNLHHPGPADPQYASDLAFVGTGFASRIAFLERMDLGGVDVLLAGNWTQLSDDSPLRTHVAHDEQECVDNEQTAEIYRAAKLGLNLYRQEAERPESAAGWAMSPREVEMAACGLAFLRDPRPEGDELLWMLPTFDGPADASEKLRWWLARPDARYKAARQAREAVADRTFTTAAKRLLELLDRQPTIK